MRADVRMIQRGQRLRFALEAREPLGIGDEQLGQDLDRDVAIELRVARAIHLAHAAGAERGEDLVGAEARAEGKGQPLAGIIRAGGSADGITPVQRRSGDRTAPAPSLSLGDKGGVIGDAATRSAGLTLLPQRHATPQLVEEVLEEHHHVLLLAASEESTGVSSTTRLPSGARSHCIGIRSARRDKFRGPHSGLARQERVARDGITRRDDLIARLVEQIVSSP